MGRERGAFSRRAKQSFMRHPRHLDASYFNEIFSAFITKPLSHLNLFARFSLQEKPFRRREHDDTWDAEQK